MRFLPQITGLRIPDIFKLTISILICLFAGFLGAIFTTPAIPAWYVTLLKPSFAPPNWLFFPAWTILFIMMGISLFLVWKKGLEDQKIKRAVSIFIVQLIFNVLWSVAFFGLKSPIAGLIVISILWIFIFYTIMNFLKVSRTGGLLLIPYIMWVSFAAVLNFYIWRLNN